MYEAEGEIISRVEVGVKNRVERLRAIGNGQVPAVARIAFMKLLERMDNNLPAWAKSEIWVGHQDANVEV